MRVPLTLVAAACLVPLAAANHGSWDAAYDDGVTAFQQGEERKVVLRLSYSGSDTEQTVISNDQPLTVDLSTSSGSKIRTLFTRDSNSYLRMTNEEPSTTVQFRTTIGEGEVPAGEYQLKISFTSRQDYGGASPGSSIKEEELTLVAFVTAPNSDEETTMNRDSGESTDDPLGIPGPALPLIVGSLVGAAVLRRRE